MFKLEHETLQKEHRKTSSPSVMIETAPTSGDSSKEKEKSELNSKRKTKEEEASSVFMLHCKSRIDTIPWETYRTIDRHRYKYSLPRGFDIFILYALSSPSF